MASKTYLLKKDLKTFIIKSNEKFIKTFKCYSPSPQRSNPYHPVTDNKKRLGIVTKSLQSIKSKRRDYRFRSPTSTHPITSNRRHLLISNLRYLLEDYEEDEEHNILETPSESIKSRGKGLEETINCEYKEYIEGICKKSKIVRSDAFGNIGQLKKRKSKNALCDSPLDLSCFWKARRTS